MGHTEYFLMYAEKQAKRLWYYKSGNSFSRDGRRGRYWDGKRGVFSVGIDLFLDLGDS